MLTRINMPGTGDFLNQPLQGPGDREWQPIWTAPFDFDLQLSVIEHDEVHALTFPCRRTARGWVKSFGKAAVPVSPTHWRPWLNSST